MRAPKIPFLPTQNSEEALNTCLGHNGLGSMVLVQSVTCGDFNQAVHLGLSPRQGAALEQWKDRLLAGDRLPALAALLHLGEALQRRRARPADVVPGPVPRHGLGTADRPPEPARHRSLPAGAAQPPLLHALLPRRPAQHAGRRQQAPRLAHLRRLRPSPRRPGATAPAKAGTLGGSSPTPRSTPSTRPP